LFYTLNYQIKKPPKQINLLGGLYFIKIDFFSGNIEESMRSPT